MSRYVFICDHASNAIPAELHDLGLPASELERHIAYDIGAAGVTQNLAETFGAPALYSPYSRLVIDCNRHLDARDLIPEISDRTIIPGNQNLTAGQRADRVQRWFLPYHDRIEHLLDELAQPILISVHSMTPNLAVQARPWQLALSSAEDRTLAEPMLAALREEGDIVVGDNQPYNLDPAVDYSTPFHALRRGLRHLQVEFRQDEVATEAGQQKWAARFAAALGTVCPSRP